MNSLKTVTDLPLDCWGHIVTFLDCEKDLLSVFLSIKHFLEYVKNENPLPTRFICFKLHNIPSTVHSEVTNIEGGTLKPVNDCEIFCGSYGYRNVHDLLDSITLKFPNLMDLKFKYERNEIIRFEGEKIRCVSYEERQRAEHQLVTGKWNVPRIHLRNKDIRFKSLVVLSLSVSECDLTIHESFPNLRKMQIISIGRYYHYEIIENESIEEKNDNHNEEHSNYEIGMIKNDLLYANRIDCSMGTNFFKKNQLDIDWSCFPSIISIELVGWECTNSKNSTSIFDNKMTNDRLKELNLDFTTFSGEQYEIIDFPNLNSLYISHESVSVIKKIDNLREIKIIRIETETKLSSYLRDWDTLEHHGIDDHFPGLRMSIWRISKLPIVELYLSNNSRQELRLSNPENTMVIDDLPNLKLIHMYRIRYKIVLTNTPSLQTLQNSCGYDGHFSMPNADDGKSLQKINFHLCRHCPQTQKNIPLFKNVTNLTISGQVYDDETEPVKFMYLDLHDFTNLTQLYISDPHLRLRSLRNCPKLKEVSVDSHKVPIDFCLENMPSLTEFRAYRGTGIVNRPESEEGIEKSCFLNIYNQLKKMKSLEIIQLEKVPKNTIIRMNSEDFPNLKSLQMDKVSKIEISSVSPEKTMKLEELRIEYSRKIKLVGLENMKIVRIQRLHNAQLDIIRCRIEELSLVSFVFRKPYMVEHYVNLENSKFGNTVFGSWVCLLDRFRMENVRMLENNSKLTLILVHPKLRHERKEEEDLVIDLNERTCPNLEYLKCIVELPKDEERERGRLKIKRIAGLKSLKEIEIVRCEGYKKKSEMMMIPKKQQENKFVKFVENVENIDLEKVVVKLKKGYQGTWNTNEREVEEFSFGEYLLASI